MEREKQVGGVLGGVLVLRLAPTVFAGPVAARLVTRWSRRRMMLAMDLVRIYYWLIGEPRAQTRRSPFTALMKPQPA